MKKTQIFIFDLDDTVIDSSHRAKLAVEDGKVVLDLEAWKRDSTHKNIMKDSLLPLATYMRECIQAEHTYVWVCTARNMQSADHEFLAKHGLTPNLVLSRQLDDDTADHILKKKMIGKLLNQRHDVYCVVNLTSNACLATTKHMNVTTLLHSCHAIELMNNKIP